ncbi:MAG: DUF4143 domain-containing protein [Propionibacteriaceae bacterium]|jgi:predicted AAA+ superfamily ATPase|nr:DUF4143 domain-containing protein [Propionibacteriaceae bacterium]
MSYRSRVVDQEVREALRDVGAVLIEGPKACGKTSTAEQMAASVLRVDVDPSVPLAMETDPGLLLEGPTPRLLDEWQVEPSLWNQVRRAVDDRAQPGQFLLAGSATPSDDVRRHSGAGRFAKVRMRPMSLWESGDSTGQVSLAALLDDQTQTAAPTEQSLTTLAQLVVRGGWPQLIGGTPRQTGRFAVNYLTLIAEADLTQVIGGRRDPERVTRLIRALAHGVATSVTQDKLARDAGLGDRPLARDTVTEYLEGLSRLMVLEDQPAWSPTLRSHATARRAARRHFVDPSLAAAALNATPERLLRELPVLGALFESLVVRDLRVYAQALGGRILHYRDSTDREADAIIVLPDGSWAACEIKLGPAKANQAAASLKRLADTIDTAVVGPLRALIVLTGSGPVVRRPDGVHVVPIGTLRP